MKKLLLLLLLAASLLHAQEKDSLRSAADTSQYYYYTPPKDTVIYKPRGKYFAFLSSQDSGTQARLFMAGLGYKCTVQSNSFKLNGLSLTVGINLARFFTRKMILGCFLNIRPLNGFVGRQYFSPAFINDFNASFNTNYSSQQDSAIAYEFGKAVNEHRFSGNQFYYAGVMLSLFPQRYGGILLSAKRGVATYRLSNIYGNTFINKGETETLFYSMPQNYCFELTFKPYAFFRNSFITAGKKNGPLGFFKFVTCSFFYERLNLKGSSVESVKLSAMTNSAFMNKYGTAECYGFSVGLSFY